MPPFCSEGAPAFDGVAKVEKKANGGRGIETGWEAGKSGGPTGVQWEAVGI